MKGGENKFVTSITKNGRITIPKRILNALDISDGDFVEITVTPMVLTLKVGKGQARMREEMKKMIEKVVEEK